MIVFCDWIELASRNWVFQVVGERVRFEGGEKHSCISKVWCSKSDERLTLENCDELMLCLDVGEMIFYVGCSVLEWVRKGMA
jgi:hypothetical protein